VALCLLACSKTNRESKLPSFTGVVGQLNADHGFMEFVRQHESGGPVSLDLKIPDSQFYGGEETEFSFFVVFDDCENLPSGQAPSQTYCTGTEFNLSHWKFAREDGFRRVKGTFQIGPEIGPHQGLISVSLDPRS
jgi:hypothetical protein